MGLGWAILGLISALNSGTASIVEKKVLLKQHAMEFSATLAIITFLLTAPLWLVSYKTVLSLKAIGLIYLASALWTVAFLLAAKAMRHIAISMASPFFAFEPLMTVLLAIVMLGEKITGTQGLGILVLVIGTYILLAHEHDSLLDPFKHLFKLKQIRLILLSILLYAISSIIDKRIVGAASDGGLAVPVLAYLPLAHFFLALNLVVLMIIFHDGFKGIEKGMKHNWKWLLVIGILFVVSRLTFQFAMAMPGVLVSLLIPIKRLSTFFATLVGGEIFHEKNILRKGIACAVMIIGAALILL